MMTVKALMEAGRLDDAVACLGAELQARPTDRQGRTFLFELLCFAGDFDRAERHLDVLGQQGGDPETGLGVRLYRGLLEAERSRARLFSEGVRPRFMFEVPPAVELHLRALDEIRLKRFAEARALLDRADGLGAPPRGTAIGTTFEEFRDADDRLALVLEVFTPAGYFWVPWEQVQYLEVAPPHNLRDLLWAPAKLATWDGQPAEVFLPNVYPGSASHPEGLARLGRKTDWLDTGEGVVQGSGQKVFLVGDDARTLYELGEVRFSPPRDEFATPGGGNCNGCVYRD
jgi:type VI secretion system protein ImpE